MNRISYKLGDAARALDITRETLVRLRDEGHVITYKIGRTEYVTDYALRDLQMRLEARDGSVMAAINDKAAYELPEAARLLGITLPRLEELRDIGLLITCCDDGEYVTSHDLKGLQHRVNIGACSLGETVRIGIPFGGDSIPKP